MCTNNDGSEGSNLGGECQTLLSDEMTKLLEEKAERSTLLSVQFANLSHGRTHGGIVSLGTDPSSSSASCFLPCSADADNFRDKFVLLERQSSKVETVTPGTIQRLAALDERVVAPQPDFQRELRNLQCGTSGTSTALQVLLVHEQEGSGETETLVRQCKVTSCLRKKVLEVSFRGGTITVFDKRNATEFTIVLRHASDSSGSTAPYQNMKTKLRKLLSSASVVVVDQVSSQSPSRLAQLSDAFKLSTGRRVPFGGLCVVLVGDFCQLAPVRGRAPLPNSAVNLTSPRLLQATNPELGLLSPTEMQSSVRSKLLKDIQTKLNSENPRGSRADLHRNACFVKITQQVKVRDPTQTVLVETMYNGGAIGISNLKQYRLLSANDFNGICGDWSSAPIIVSTHRERLSITHDQAINFALANNTVVVRWEMKISKWGQRPPEEFLSQAKKDPCFYQYFVSGAPAYLNSTINKDLCLIDSTPVTLESIMMEDEISQRSVLEMVAAASPGDVITLEDTPEFVNVRVETKKFSVAVKKMYRDHFRPVSSSEAETVFVLPIGVGNSLGVACSVPVPGVTDLFRASRLVVEPPFRFDTAFAATIHSTMGRSLKQAILVLSKGGRKRWLSFGQLHVGLSKVTGGGNSLAACLDR